MTNNSETCSLSSTTHSNSNNNRSQAVDCLPSSSWMSLSLSQEKLMKAAWAGAELKERMFLKAVDLYGEAEEQFFSLQFQQQQDEEDNTESASMMEQRLVAAEKLVAETQKVMVRASEAAVEAHAEVRDLYHSIMDENEKENEPTPRDDDLSKLAAGNFYDSRENFVMVRNYMRTVDARVEKMKRRASSTHHNVQDAAEQHAALMKGQAQRDHQWKAVREHWIASC